MKKYKIGFWNTFIEIKDIKYFENFRDILAQNIDRLNDYFELRIFNDYKEMKENMLIEAKKYNLEVNIDDDIIAQTWNFRKINNNKIKLCHGIMYITNKNYDINTISHEVFHLVLGYIRMEFPNFLDKIKDAKEIKYEELMAYMIGYISNAIAHFIFKGDDKNV